VFPATRARTKGTKDAKKSKGPEGKAMRADIEGYCARIVEEQEEGLQAGAYARLLYSST